MAMTDYIEERYDDTFESVYSSLSRMVEQDSDRAEYSIRGILKGLYVRQGNDWTGRGAIGNAGLDASIAAYECILAEINGRHTNGKGETRYEKQT
ncbi:MAG: hypothetical protein PHP95_10490 [Desulfuromonadaceae bacterium]|nr:hypothetical protein [Desulfuromonadaceae bacterium]MDD2848873.1 hypothetical protein [Desulfuromonadaceae bacterium]MDD4132170.1 hypothetical protein [Desulfuromonadaceae bacterium]